MVAKQESISIEQYMQSLGERARQASRAMSMASTAQKNNALQILATKLLQEQSHLMEVNQLDLRAGKERGLESALLDRLELTVNRIQAMADGLQQIASLQDPVGQVENLVARPSGHSSRRIRSHKFKPGDRRIYSAVTTRFGTAGICGTGS